MIELDRDMIHAGASDKGGFTKRQLEVLGVEWPPLKGWLTALVGTRISQEDYDRFRALCKHPREPAQGELPMRLPFL